MAVLVAFQSEYLTGSIEEVGGLLAGRFVAIGEAGARRKVPLHPAAAAAWLGVGAFPVRQVADHELLSIDQVCALLLGWACGRKGSRVGWLYEGGATGADAPRAL